MPRASRLLTARSHTALGTFTSLQVLREEDALATIAATVVTSQSAAAAAAISDLCSQLQARSSDAHAHSLAFSHCMALVVFLELLLGSV